MVYCRSKFYFKIRIVIYKILKLIFAKIIIRVPVLNVLRRINCPKRQEIIVISIGLSWICNVTKERKKVRKKERKRNMYVD